LPKPPLRRRSRLARLFVVGAAVFGASGLLYAVLPTAPLRALFQLSFACFLLLGLAWAFRVVWSRFFWRVGRRLAFSYLLLGLLPLLLVSILVALASFLLGGFLLGHLYRDTVDQLRDEVEAVARLRLLADAPAPLRLADGAVEVRAADYRRGRRTGGDAGAPAVFPAWLESAQAARAAAGDDESRRPYVALEGGRLSIAAVARAGERATLVWLDGDLDSELRRRTRSWVQLFRSDDPRELETTRVQVGGSQLVLRGLWLARRPQETEEFYRLNPPAGEQPGLTEKPVILWMERSRGVRALADGTQVADSVTASLAARRARAASPGRCCRPRSRPTRPPGWCSPASRCSCSRSTRRPRRSRCS
jgi:hypothetical protein